jgi:hypothetical protein
VPVTVEAHRVGADPAVDHAVLVGVLQGLGQLDPDLDGVGRVEAGVGEGGVTNGAMPRGDRDLAGNEGGGTSASILDDLERKRAHDGRTFAAAMIRRPGAQWFVMMTPEHFATLLREATA